MIRPFPAALPALLLSLLPFSGTAAPQKNVLFIVVDDLRNNLGCYGNTKIQTPHIDAFAGKAMRFDRAYCQYPICNPSRASFLTGLRPDTTTILGNGFPLRGALPDVVTLPQLFRQNGWFSASLGKIIHDGFDERGQPALFLDPLSFDDNRNFKETAAGKEGEGRHMFEDPQLRKEFRWCRWLAAEGDDEDQPDGQTAAEAIKLMEAHRDKPFFLAVGFHKPHDPFIAPKKYFDLYPLEEIELPAEPGDASTLLPIAIPKDSPDKHFTDRERKEYKRAYYACTSFADAQVGKLLDTLTRLNLWDNTIVTLIGDNGYHLGEHHHFGKVTLFELCSRVPLIVWQPGAAGMGRPSGSIVELVDLYPTIAAFGGLPPPGNLEGRSMAPVLEDPAQSIKSAAFTQVKTYGRSVRAARWRYTEWREGADGVELYDAENDPMEYHNLAEKPEFKGVVGEMSRTLRAGPPPPPPAAAGFGLR